MKPASRIQANIEIFEQSHLARVPLDSVVGDYMRQRRYIGSKDRAEIAQRCYNVMRSYARLSWWLEKTKTEDTPRARVMAYLALGEGADQKRIKDLFDGSKYAPEEISPQEAHTVKQMEGQPLNHPDMPAFARTECPPAHEEQLRALFGEDFEAEMNAMLRPAKLDLRVNIFTCDRGKAKNALEKDGVKTEETPYSPWGLRCDRKAFISRTKAWTKGWVEIQDEGSQLIAHLCGLAMDLSRRSSQSEGGMQVLDYCAGAGGKTLALAAAMQRKGRIVAMDIDARRLEKGRQRYKKAQLADIIELRCLEDDKQRKWLKRQKGKFDIVLTDVPCSGSGTWRRNPDMRWRTYGPALAELTALQSEILDKAAPAVKPGGKLVYATCSLFREENEAQIEAFLERHPEFTLLPVSQILADSQSNILSGEAQGAEHSKIYASDEAIKPEEILGRLYMRLTPHRHKTDGFFTAILVRTP